MDPAGERLPGCSMRRTLPTPAPRSPMRRRTEQVRSTRSPLRPLCNSAKWPSRASAAPAPLACEVTSNQRRRNLSLSPVLTPGKIANEERHQRVECDTDPARNCPTSRSAATLARPSARPGRRCGDPHGRGWQHACARVRARSSRSVSRRRGLMSHAWLWPVRRSRAVRSPSRSRRHSAPLEGPHGRSRRAPRRSKFPSRCSRSPAYCLMNIQFRIVSIADTPPSRTSSSPRSRNAA